MSQYLSYNFSKLTKQNQITKDSNINKRVSERDKRILSCLNLAIELSIKYKNDSGTSMSLEDIVQFANVGLCEASDKFKESEGTKFTTYAYFWIKKHILEAINITARPLAVTHVEGFGKVTDGLKFISKDYTNKISALGRDDFNGNASDNMYEYVINSSDKDGDSHIDLETQKNIQFNVINGCLNELSEQERKITCCYFGLAPFENSSSIAEVSSKMKMNKSTVENIIGNSMHKLKKYFDGNKPEHNQSLIELTLNISKHQDKIDKVGDYINNENLHKKYKSKISERIINAGEKSGLKLEQICSAVFLDTNQNYSFYTVRDIMGLKVYKKLTIKKRNKKHGGSASFSISFTVLDKNGEVIVNDKHSHNENYVRINTINEFFEKHRINQMHSHHQEELVLV